MGDIEQLPDNVMLDDFERLLDMGAAPIGGESDRTTMAIIMEMGRFLDENGRRLLLLGRICDQAMQRQSKDPT